jgi:hypothetical protein
MDRNDGEQPLCRDKGISYLPPMTPLSSAATMRSLHSEASTHDRYGPFVSAPCLTLTGTSGATLCSRCGSHASTFLPPFPRRGFALRTSRGSRRFGTMETLTSCAAHLQRRSPRLPRHTFLSFRLQPRGLSGHRLPPRQRDQRVSDFALESQARRSPPPNRVRHPTDQQFASGCSPRCFGPTQLPSATELWHTPTRTFTVLMWRPHGRTIPAKSMRE